VKDQGIKTPTCFHATAEKQSRAKKNHELVNQSRKLDLHSFQDESTPFSRYTQRENFELQHTKEQAFNFSDNPQHARTQ